MLSFSRRVVSSERVPRLRMRWDLQLDCGHTVRLAIGRPPLRALCETCRLAEAAERECRRPAPERLVVPLAAAAAMAPQLRSWVSERIAQGDPGPVHVAGGEVWTEASEREADT